MFIFIFISFSDTQTWNVLSTENSSQTLRMQCKGFVIEEKVVNNDSSELSRKFQNIHNSESLNNDTGPSCRYTASNDEVLIQFSPSCQVKVNQSASQGKSDSENVNAVNETKPNEANEAIKTNIYPNIRTEIEAEDEEDDPPSNYASLEDLDYVHVADSDKQCLIDATENSHFDSISNSHFSLCILGGSTKDQVDWKRESITMWILKCENIV